MTDRGKQNRDDEWESKSKWELLLRKTSVSGRHEVRKG